MSDTRQHSTTTLQEPGTAHSNPQNTAQVRQPPSARTRAPVWPLAVSGWGSRWINDSCHGPLPGLLLVLTAATGLIDAVSILALGHVFVANMTGNIVFIGFAAAGAPGFSLAATLSALAGFLLGAHAGGHLAARRGTHRGVLLRDTVALELLLLVGAVAIAAAGPGPLDSGRGALIAGLAALAMGLQNATVRRLAVPDLTTTVLTMTLTGIAADIRSGNRITLGRRIAAVAAMLLGAFGGALLTLNLNAAAALAAAGLLVAGVLAAAFRASRSPATWTRA
jgi:uncharacterized membrane protein YoaK (UPF0700 family)